MCDYSLEMMASRPARAGEYYVTTRFHSGSIGLAVAGDMTCAICVQYGTPLMLSNLPSFVRGTLQAEAVEAVFARLESGAYRDAISLPDGRVLSLQQIGTGVSIRVKALIDRPLPTVARTEAFATVD